MLGKMLGKRPCSAQRCLPGVKAQGLGSTTAAEEGPGSGSLAEGQEQSQLQTAVGHVFLNQNNQVGFKLLKTNSQKKREGQALSWLARGCGRELPCCRVGNCFRLGIACLGWQSGART